ncbi:MAG: hypothetical protein Q4P30_01615 [Eubacteriales bacterium]|nr:hypothetical protein [Eubacteriales bacterium]
MKKEEEKRYLRFSYVVMILATLVMLVIMVGIFFIEHALWRAMFFSAAYVMGTIMFFIMGARERRIGIRVRAVLYFSAAVSCAVLSAIYFIRRVPALMEGFKKLSGAL